MRERPTVSLVIPLLALLLAAQGVGAASDFAVPAFRDRWQQDERQVPNFWGPLALASGAVEEMYGYPGICGTVPPCLPPRETNRIVQYFDKGRMEFNGASTPGSAPVTSGLLVREMISGEAQYGDTQTEKRAPAAIAIAGDPDNTFPKYSDLTTAKIPPTIATGAQPVTQLNPDGSTSAAPAPSGPASAAAAIATTDTATRIAVPTVFNDFRARVGTDVIGYAITGPFYVNVRVGGVQRRVLMQAFERRVLTYNAANPPEFQVEFGNVGRHYYRWRYGTELPG